METTTNSVAFPRLLHSAQRGRTQAQDELFTRYYPIVERIAHAQLRRLFGRGTSNLTTRFSTADVVQEVFSSLMKSLEAFSGQTEGEFVVYVTRVVRSRVLDALRFHSASCRDYRRSRSAAAQRTIADVLEALPAPSAVRLQEGGLRERFRSTLASFDARTQALLRGRIEGGLGFASLAEQNGYPSRFAARRAFFSAQAQLIVRMGMVDNEAPRSAV